jgi:fermentation-respiration switch protein FrsA (DUF1100 family)
MPSLATLLLAPFGAVLAGYVSLVAGMVAMQRRLLYRPLTGPADPAAAGTPWLAPVRKGDHLLGWYAPPPSPDAPVLVYFHGNRGTLGRVAVKTASWPAMGLGLFAATYRGFEGNAGSPDEAGLYTDGRAVLDWLAEQGVDSGKIILYGESLGSGVAVQLAVERDLAAIVLEAPFASIAQVAADRYPWTPAGRLVRDRFDSQGKIGRIKVPLLILHGDADQTIPLSHAQRLVKAAPQARLVVVPGANHLDLHDRGASEVFQAFIKSLAECQGPKKASCLRLDPQ